MLKVLSLCDGIGGAGEALRRMGISCDYFSSEIDPEAVAVMQNGLGYQHNVKLLGDIFSGEPEKVMEPDLLVAGFPCQSFSIAGNRGGFKDERGKLFFKCLEILDTVRPRWFLLENVASMSAECKNFIDEKLGVKAIKVNSAWFGPQRRWRYYWTNIPFDIPSEPERSCEVLGDVIGKYPMPKFELTDPRLISAYELLEDGQNWKDLPEDHVEKVKILKVIQNFHDRGGKNAGGRTGFFKLYDKKEKAPTLTASGIKQNMTRFVFRDFCGKLRYPSFVECARLQGFPEMWCRNSEKSYHFLGNAFSVPTIRAFLEKIH